MTEREFVYWLQGFIEVSDVKKINEAQTQIIKDHLALVLDKVTPVYVSRVNPPTLNNPLINFDRTPASC